MLLNSNQVFFGSLNFLTGQNKKKTNLVSLKCTENNYLDNNSE